MMLERGKFVCLKVVREGGVWSRSTGGKWGLAVRKIGPVKVVSLCGRRILGGVKEVRIITVVVGRPFMKVVRDVESCGIGASIFKVDHNDLDLVSRTRLAGIIHK